MLTHIYKTDEGLQATTLGCGCCSTTIHNKGEMIDELTGNYKLLVDACALLNISISTLEELTKNRFNK